MHACDYCDQSFDSEDAYLSHLRSEHQGELGRVDQRRVEQQASNASQWSIPTGPAILVGIFLIVGAILVYITVFTESSQNTARAHIHGDIAISVDSENVPVTQRRGTEAFHFHESDQWHVEAQRPTLREALRAIGIEANSNSITINGQSYNMSSSGVSVTYQVDGSAVNPDDYVLEEGDTIQIAVDTDSN